MLTNANFAYCVESIINCADRYPGGRLPGPDDVILTYLPLCHVAERLFSTWHLVSRGAVLNFAESIDTVTENLREVQPTLFFAVPRIWEKLHASIVIRGQDATWLKRHVLRAGLAIAGRVADEKAAHGGEHTWRSRLLAGFGWVIVFRAVKERIGLRHCRYAACGAAPIARTIAALEEARRGSVVRVSAPKGTEFTFRFPEHARVHRNIGDASREKVRDAVSVRDSDMARIVLVRHGHVEGIEPARFRGRRDVDLSDLGVRQAQATARGIALQWRPSTVYSSPLGRYIRTAEAIAAALGLSIAVLEDLNDLHYGDWEWRTYEEVRAR